MKIYTKLVIDMTNNNIIEEESYDYSGPIARCDRAAQAAAQNAIGTTKGQVATYGSNAAQIGSAVTPTLIRNMNNPMGMSQKDVGAIQTNALAGAAGAGSGLAGTAGKFGMATRNPMGFSSALDASARAGAKGAAGVASGTAAENAKVKLGQQQDAEKELGSLYGTNVDAQMKAQGLDVDAVNALTDAGKSGWLQNMNATTEAVADAATAAAKLGVKV